MLSLIRPRGPAVPFVHPLDPAPRTAILVPGFQSTGEVRVFPGGWDRAAESFLPAAVAGTFDQLLAVAERGVRISHGVICLTWDSDSLLSAHQRDLLWDALGVPIFEQYLGPGNVLLAYECEAHKGLHATARYKGPTIEAACDCGKGVRVSFLPGGRAFAAAANA